MNTTVPDLLAVVAYVVVILRWVTWIRELNCTEVADYDYLESPFYPELINPVEHSNADDNHESRCGDCKEVPDTPGDYTKTGAGLRCADLTAVEMTTKKCKCIVGQKPYRRQGQPPRQVITKRRDQRRRPLHPSHVYKCTVPIVIIQ